MKEHDIVPYQTIAVATNFLNPPRVGSIGIMTMKHVHRLKPAKGQSKRGDRWVCVCVGGGGAESSSATEIRISLLALHATSSLTAATSDVSSEIHEGFTNKIITKYAIHGKYVKTKIRTCISTDSCFRFCSSTLFRNSILISFLFAGYVSFSAWRWHI